MRKIILAALLALSSTLAAAQTSVTSNGTSTPGQPATWADGLGRTIVSTPVLGVPVGGTGQSTLSAHGVLLGQAQSGVTAATPSSPGQLLIDQGPGNDPAWKPISGGMTINASGIATVGFNVLGSFWTDITNADGAANAHINSFRDRLFVDDGALNAGAWNSGAGSLANSRSGTAINSVNWNWAPREASLLSISSWGELAVVGMSVSSSANRSGDPHSATGASPIGVAGFGLNDRTTNPITSWGLYGEALRKTAGVGNAFGVELDTGNVGAIIDIDPFSFPVAGTGVSVGVWNNCGGSAGGAVTYTNCTAAMGIGNNGARYRRGIVFNSAALDTAVGTAGGGVAMDMSIGQEFRWLSAAATPVMEVWASANGLTVKNPSAGGGHLGVVGTAPGISACGTTPGTAAGTDYAGHVTEGTTATGCTLTFATAFSIQPHCTANLNAGGTAVAVAPNSVSTTAVAFVHASQSGAVLNWHCDGN